MISIISQMNKENTGCDCTCAVEGKGYIRNEIEAILTTLYNNFPEEYIYSCFMMLGRIDIAKNDSDN